MLTVTSRALLCLGIVVVWRTTLLGNKGEKWPLNLYSSKSSVRQGMTVPDNTWSKSVLLFRFTCFLLGIESSILPKTFSLGQNFVALKTTPHWDQILFFLQIQLSITINFSKFTERRIPENLLLGYSYLFTHPKWILEEFKCLTDMWYVLNLCQQEELPKHHGYVLAFKYISGFKNQPLLQSIDRLQ